MTFSADYGYEQEGGIRRETGNVAVGVCRGMNALKPALIACVLHGPYHMRV